jgi:hypothetical protein
MQLLKTPRARAAQRGAAAIVAASAIALSLSPASRAAPTSPAEAQRQANWRDAIAKLPTPAEGCFKAAYPTATWTKVQCTVAPTRPYMPRHGHRGYTVGNGNDYAAVVSTIIGTAVGNFPTVTGLKTETGYGGQANAYSLQLNSQFFTTSVCNGASNPSNCLGWEQFVYSNTSQAAFMQYWLINYGNSCPSGGWMSYSGSCYRNSAAVSTPAQTITQLPYLKVSAKAVSGGTDTFVFTTKTEAYTTTGNDSVVNLAKAWHQSEFNVVGDGGGSAAKFNKGTSLTVKIALTDGSSSAPTCEGDDGTTGETNNLTLGSCSTAGGSTPSVTFTEKH